MPSRRRDEARGVPSERSASASIRSVAPAINQGARRRPAVGTRPGAAQRAGIRAHAARGGRVELNGVRDSLRLGAAEAPLTARRGPRPATAPDPASPSAIRHPRRSGDPLPRRWPYEPVGAVAGPGPRLAVSGASAALGRQRSRAPLGFARPAQAAWRQSGRAYGLALRLPCLIPSGHLGDATAPDVTPDAPLRTKQRRPPAQPTAPRHTRIRR